MTSSTDLELLRDLIEERAALIEDGEQCSRAEAKRRAASMHGFADWKAVEAAIGRRER